MKKIIRLFILIYLGSLSIVCNSQDLVDVSQILAYKLSMPVESIRNLRLGALNNHGEICGQYTSYTHPSINSLFIIKKDKAGKLTDYASMGEYPYGEIVALTDKGDVVFNMKNSSPDNFYPFVIECKDGMYEKKDSKYKYTMLTEGSIPGMALSVSGEKIIFKVAIGEGKDYLKFPTHDSILVYLGQAHIAKPFVYNLKTGTKQPLATRGGSSWKYYSQVSAMNQSGSYCGTTQGFGGDIFSKRLIPFYTEDDSTYLLLQGVEGFPVAMNNAAEICGVWFDTYTGKMNGFYWGKKDNDNEVEGWQDLGKGQVRIPVAINNKGVVAGNEVDGKHFKPFLFKAGKISYLQDLLSSGQYKGLKPEKIFSLNDKFILVQVSENNTKKVLRLKYSSDMSISMSQ